MSRHCILRSLLIGMLLPAMATAEPYLAVQKGLKCATCHIAPSGGGKRTTYGNVFAQAELPERTLDMGSLWTGDVGKILAVGGDLRGGWERTAVPSQPNTSKSSLEEFLAYAELRAIPRYLALYVDGRLRPDDPYIREQYARLKFPNGRWSIRAGQFFLPFGWRLQDDTAFIRQVGGINYNTPDKGTELEFEQGRWTAQFAVTRGTAGGPETDSGKQYSLRIANVRAAWQIGGSLNFNDAKVGDRQMQNVFVGLKTGPVAWLAELDYIRDESSPTGRRNSWATFFEANYGYRKGHNLKVTYEWYDPDNQVSEDEQNRISAVWEYTPFQFVQARIGLRNFTGIPQNPAQNREQTFAEIHMSF